MNMDELCSKRDTFLVAYQNGDYERVMEEMYNIGAQTHLKTDNTNMPEI